MNVHSADRISKLPDELLENILSRLTMREAVATSLISRRWKQLWTYSTGSFDFDFGSASAALNAMKKNQVFTFLPTERFRYIHRVNKFTRFHKGPTIDAFMIKFDLQSNAANHINTWIKFAIRKRVRRLELDLTRVDLKNGELTWTYNYLFRIKNCYAFPLLESLDKKKKPNLSWLTSLNLNFVDMNGETVEYILSNCPVLEYMRILNSPSLAGVRVVDTCPKLKHLEISHCHSLEFLDISSAPKLTSLSYSGPKETKLCFRNVPNLVDVSLGGNYCISIVERFGELPLALSQIQKLKLSPCTLIPRFCKFPELKRVTQLELEFKSASDLHSCLSCAYAIEACPNLRSLSVQLYWLRIAEQRKIGEQAKERSKRSNKWLKEVELCGFRGSRTDVEIATYIFSTAPFLEKITVDTMFKTTQGSNPVLSAAQYLRARKLAWQLASQFCPAAQLFVL